MDSPTPLSSPSPSAKRRLWIWRTPLTFLAVYCLISVLLRENYPISHYPMYAKPSADRAYYIVGDAATGKPLPVATVSSITCPKVGKIYRKMSEEMAEKLKVNKSGLSAAQQQEIGVAIFQELRRHAKDTKASGLPPKLMLQRVDILWRDGELMEKPTLLASE